MCCDYNLKKCYSILASMRKEEIYKYTKKMNNFISREINSRIVKRISMFRYRREVKFKNCILENLYMFFEENK